MQGNTASNEAHGYEQPGIADDENGLIHELFEIQANAVPTRNAVSFGSESLSYSQLNARANQLAHYLRAAGITSGGTVGVCVERGVEMVVALLGIIKAGAAYIPLDPNYPAERLRNMLEDASPAVLLTHSGSRSAVPECAARVIELDREQLQIARQPAGNLPAFQIGVSCSDLVYVIYTSGSTGRPKGTAMPHGAVFNLIQWQRRELPLRRGQRVLQFAALSFDVAFQEIFSTLCDGGTLVLLSEKVRRDAQALLELLVEERVERMFMPPLMLQALAEQFGSSQRAPQLALKDVITAGEQLRITAEIREMFRQVCGCRLHNHYGPTETHVVTALTLPDEIDAWPQLPTIGRPIDHLNVHVLDASLRPVATGVIAEIYIGGIGIARGYLGRPDVTMQRFVADPCGAPGRRMYRTGDVGRWRADGCLEYLGRNDDQVKIRGYRIELGEVEAQLAMHPLIKEAAVVVREEPSAIKTLVAYLTLRGNERINVAELRDHAKALLPEHMIPSAFVVLEKFPLTPNGKLDRRNLPAPDMGACAVREYEPPQGAVEEQLAAVWRDLLKVDPVGRDDDFFALGGHSLLLVRMTAMLRLAGLPANASCVFQHPSLAGMAEALIEDRGEQFEVPENRIPQHCARITPDLLPLLSLEQHCIDLIVRHVPGGVSNVQDIYPLTALQEGVLFHHRFDCSEGDIYVLPILLTLASRGRLDAFIHALQRVVGRHDALRTIVLWEQLPHPVQVVCRHADLQVETFQLQAERGALDQLKERMDPRRQRLNLSHAPLLRVSVAADPGGVNWYALLQLHHVICDHDSLENLLAELGAIMAGKSSELPRPTQFRDHVAYARANANAASVERFFTEKLGDIDEPSAPFGLLDVRAGAGRIEVARQRLDAALADRVRSLARRLGMSAAILFHAAWALVVGKTGGSDAAVFGTVLLGRLRGESQGQAGLGLFMNTLPICLRLQGATARQFVEHTQREVLALLEHEHAPLATAQRCSGVNASVPLFSTLLNYLHSDMHVETEQPFLAPGVQVLALNEWTNYPIAVSVDDQADKFVLTVQAGSGIDPRRVIGYLSTAMRSLTNALESQVQMPVAPLSILPDAERSQVMVSFNATDAAHPTDLLAHELFEAQAKRDPHRVAVTCGSSSMTYRQLNRRSNQLARYLRRRGVGPDQLVAVFLDRGLDMIVALLGILKAGAGYVPLDVSYPKDRLAHTVQDSSPAVVLIQRRVRELPFAVERMVVDVSEPEIALQSTDNLARSAVALHPDHLAYVIYTSGSTGVPKGVMVEHSNLVNLIHWHCSTFNVTRDSRCCALAAAGFDAAVWEIWPPLSVGATLAVASPAVSKEVDTMLEWWANEPLDIAFLTTPVAEFAFNEAIHNQGVQTLLVGGDRLRSQPRPRAFRLINNYGPTEATVVATCGEVSQHDPLPDIGRPIDNARIYILDRHGQAAPIGVTGEIHIGGAGIARGYLHRPELSADRFVADPFSPVSGQRMYRTGDLARWRPDGRIDYVGRNDHQVKIRGFRIELGEIESTLLKQPALRDGVVLAREDRQGEKHLVAYVVAAQPGKLDILQLRNELKTVLPQHMVPAAFVLMNALPLTANGKVNRNGLPAPDESSFVTRQFEAPMGELENLIANTWQEVLRVERVGRFDNFFDLGGHSLLATRVTTRISEALDFDVPVRSLFEAPTVQTLGVRIVEEATALKPCA
jgi:amino acid adenylation domain-containing protein